MPLIIERLQYRLLTAAGWHNADLPCDVDGSSLVAPFDAMLVINSLNSEGARSFLLRGRNPLESYFDVSGDNLLSPIDALLVINALNQAGPLPTLAVSTAASDDPNGNGVLISEHVRVTGQTTPRSRVTIRLEEEEEEGSKAITLWQNYADANGRFEVIVPLTPGPNTFLIEARDELGRKATLQKSWFRGDIVTDWNATALNAVRDWTGISNDPYTGRIVPSQPPLVARNLAMIHAALFDAANAVAGRYESYLPNLTRDPDASEIAAAATAAHRVASSLYPSLAQQAVWDATLQESLRLVTDVVARQRGIALGESVAASLLAARRNDGAATAVAYVPSSEPGRWNRTEPDRLPPLLPQWPNVRPFSVGDITAFRAAEPPALTSIEYAAAVDEVMRLGRLDSSVRTSEQTETVHFWADGAGTATPPGHWNRIASDYIARHAGDLVENSRSMALLNLALADAGIASWDTKYHYDLWRPIDAIRRADVDGNSATQQDSVWTPLLKTPPFPSYTSGHSTFSGAAAEILTQLFGDDVRFTSTSDPLSGLTQRPLSQSLIVKRTFDNFYQAAEEAGASRIYGGIHFRFDNSAGLATGKIVAQHVIESFLRPSR